MKRILLSAVIGVVLAGSAGLAQADPATASAGSWMVAFANTIMCVAGDPSACSVDPNKTTNPTVKNM